MHGRRRRRIWWRWRIWWRRGWRAAAIAVDHVLNVHEAALVRVLVDCRRCGCLEGVGAIRSRRQRRILGALEGAVAGDWRIVQRAAPAMDLVISVYNGAHNVLIGLIEVGFLHRNGHIARPPKRRRRTRRRRRRRRRRTRRRRRVATSRRRRKRRRRRARRPYPGRPRRQRRGRGRRRRCRHRLVGTTVRRVAFWRRRQLVRVRRGGASIVRAGAHVHVALQVAVLEGGLVAVEAHRARRRRLAHRGVGRREPARQVGAAGAATWRDVGHAVARGAGEAIPLGLVQRVGVVHRLPFGRVASVLMEIVRRVDVPRGIRERLDVAKRLRAARVAERLRQGSGHPRWRRRRRRRRRRR